MGHGVVGGGVAEIIATHKQKLFSAVGEDIYIKHILDLREFPDSPFADRFTKNFEDISNDIEVRIVVETMGGLHPSYEYVKDCLLKGKSVVTSNKELVAAYGAELLAIASEQNANFLFEASVGGGIPIIRPMNQCLVANNVSEIAGILNGTTNFILTKMIRENMSFEKALKLAQELGYAERNPAADVEGHDACRKICILASLAFGKHIYPDAVRTEGITDITLEDVEYASIWGGVIKLIGTVKKVGKDTIDIIVAPMFVPLNSQLANIDDVFNGMSIARAVLEYVADKKKLGARSLFATHYHELTVMEELLEGVKNYNIAVKKRGDEITFLRRIIPGGADESYGVEVAKLAGLPDSIIERAKEILRELNAAAPEKTHVQTDAFTFNEPAQLSLMPQSSTAIEDRLRAVDVNTLTPIEAMNVLYELKNLID